LYAGQSSSHAEGMQLMFFVNTSSLVHHLSHHHITRGLILFDIIEIKGTKLKSFYRAISQTHHFLIVLMVIW